MGLLKVDVKVCLGNFLVTSSGYRFVRIVAIKCPPGRGASPGSFQAALQDLGSGKRCGLQTRMFMLSIACMPFVVTYMSESTQTEIITLSIAWKLFAPTYMTESKHTNRNNHVKYCLYAFRTDMTESVHPNKHVRSSLLPGRKEKGRITTTIIQLWC